ncbi:MAG: hypothetical protein KatS3mg115_0446 [Candidatus Poribacteria bacterium]|nr:MAG: hypothetical protein KatS3mg115_0446 [Candidatus Poribacteria bacterium]
MFDEPHRWLQAIENRAQYIERRLRNASPAVGLSYERGALLFAFCPPGQRKIYEIYDRVALAALGHPADIERLRMLAINLAHTEGFVRSKDDVTLQRLLNFGIAPEVKANFDEVFRSPLIVKVLMVELTPTTEEPQFFTLNYDGNFSHRKNFGVVAGTHQAEELMAETIEEEYPLFRVARRGAPEGRLGLGGRLLRSHQGSPSTPIRRGPRRGTSGRRSARRGSGSVWRPPFWIGTRPSRAKYRPLTQEELRTAQEYPRFWPLLSERIAPCRDASSEPRSNTAA